MYFSIRDYLNQLFPSAGHSPILSPNRYWLLCCRWHLQCCFQSNWIERCWEIDYSQYVAQSAGLLARHYLEEINTTLLEHCWHAQLKQEIYYAHPSELFLDT